MIDRGISCPVCRWSKTGQDMIPECGSSITLLVIEDDAVDMKAIERVLEKSSLNVSRIWPATSLAEASVQLKENTPDIILLDLGLPDSSGLDSVSQLQKLAQNTPIIVLTGLTDQEIAITAVQKGVQDYLTKSCINVCSLSRAIRYAIERKEHERKLHAIEKRYRTIFENSAVAIMMFDDQDRLVSWNRVTEELLGMDREDLYCKQVEALYTESEWPSAWIQDHAQGDMPHRLETKIVKKGGALIDVDVSWSILTESRNGVDGSVYVVQDITNRKCAERQLKAAMEEAKRMNEELTEATARANDLAAQAEIASAAKSKFLANMTHEIRTPMNAVIGFSDILADLPLDPVHKEYVEIIRQSGRHLVSLLNDILDLSKIEAGRLQIEMVECELPSLLETLESMMRILAEKKGLQFHVVSNPDLPDRIYTEPVRLHQCLTNLVNNAIKFTESGHVCVRVFREDSSSDPYLRFDVEDSGVGIPKDKQQSIFEAFTQLDVDTTRRYEGTGLGLTITRSLIEMLGGSLLLKSRQGKGSVFSLRVPVGACKGKKVSTDKTNEDNDMASQDHVYEGHVLVAEDVQTNQRLVHLMLERIGLKVTIAENGDQAIKMATSRTFDLILMDVQMPGLNGLDATKALRLRGISIPIVALTAHTMREDRQECLEAGCNAYLSKPIDRAELIQIIERYLPHQAGESTGSLDSSIAAMASSSQDHVVSAMAEDSIPSDDMEIIDWPQLISRIVDEELAEDIMPICVQDNKERLDLLTMAVDEENTADVRLYAHAIKGSMLNVGANRISRVARLLEHMAGRGDLSKARDHLARIREEFDRFEALVSRPNWIEIVKQNHGDERTEVVGQSHLK